MRRVQASLAELEHLSMTEFHDEVLRRGEVRGEFRGVARGLEQGVELGREALLRCCCLRRRWRPCGRYRWRGWRRRSTHGLRCSRAVRARHRCRAALVGVGAR